MWTIRAEHTKGVSFESRFKGLASGFRNNHSVGASMLCPAETVVHSDAGGGGNVLFNLPGVAGGTGYDSQLSRNGRCVLLDDPPAEDSYARNPLPLL